MHQFIAKDDARVPCVVTTVMLMFTESFEAASDYDDTSDYSTRQFTAKVKAACVDGDTSG